MRRASTTTAILLTLTAFLTGCVSKGEEKVTSGAPAGVTTSAPSAPASTTPNQAPQPTTSTTATAEPPTTTTDPARPVGDNAAASARLAEILPRAKDVGPEYEDGGEDLIDDPPEDYDEPWGQDDDDEGEGRPSSLTDTWAQICPGAKALESPENDENTDRVTRELDGDDNSRITVHLDPTPLGIDADGVDAFLEAVDACEPVTGYSEALGDDTTTTIDATRYDAHGDLGIDVVVTGQMTFGMGPIDVRLQTISFVRDGIGVTIEVYPGRDGTTYEELPVSQDRLDRIAALMEQRVDQL